MAQQTENDMMLTWSYEAQAIESYTLGKFSEVPAHFEELVHYYHAEEHTWSPSDPKVTTSIHMSLALWQLGKIEEAREVIRAQAAHAKSISETNMAGSYLGACSLALVMSDGDWLAEKSTALSQLAKENNLPNYISWGSIYQGCANILQGNPQTGIDLLTKGIDEYLKTGTYVSLAQYLGILALGYAGIGNYEKAFLTLENAFGAVGEEAMHLHELHRIHGSLLAKTNQREEAEKAFREAIKISQQFGSLSVELRASTELGYLLLDSGDSDSARALVAPLYAKFTNGFDTPDLQAAKQLLDKLS
jgi:tetratricopeptide (TPR) repeat protein